MGCGAVIVGAGQGLRLGFNFPKAFVLLKSKPLFEYSLKVFLEHPKISEIVLVVPPDKKDIVLPLRCKAVAGGSTRQESVFNGLKTLSPDCQRVLVHDAARPFISKAILDRLLEPLERGIASIAAWPVSDTVKATEGKKIIKTIDRQNLWIAQTPQAFPISILKEALAKARADNFVGTDEASLVERLGISVQVVLGDAANIKITSPEDLILAEALLNKI